MVGPYLQYGVGIGVGVGGIGAVAWEDMDVGCWEGYGRCGWGIFRCGGIWVAGSFLAYMTLQDLLLVASSSSGTTSLRPPPAAFASQLPLALLPALPSPAAHFCRRA